MCASAGGDVWLVLGGRAPVSVTGLWSGGGLGLPNPGVRPTWDSVAKQSWGVLWGWALDQSYGV